MYINLLIPIIAVAIIALFFYFKHTKKKVFDDYLDLNVTLGFTDVAKPKSSRLGILMFHIKEVRNEPRALSISSIKLHANKIYLRSYNNLYAKLPLPIEGVILSVGIKEIDRTTPNDFESMCVTISGFILEDHEQKKVFKKKIPITYTSSLKVDSIIQN